MAHHLGAARRVLHRAISIGLPALASAAAVTLAPTAAQAQAIDAGDYVPAPDGTQLGIVYMQYANAGSLYADGKKVDDKAKLESAVTILRYVGFTKIAGMTLDYQVLQPFGHLAGGGSTRALGKTTGFGDTILVSTLWVHENPESKTYIGITPYVFVPTGEYDADRALNMGENRWKGSLQAVISQGIGKHFVAELAGDAMIYGKNTDYGAARVTMTQKPTYRVQAFARYLLDDTNEINARLMHVSGGETKIAGLEQDNVTKTTSVLGTWRHTLSPKWQLMTQAGTDLAVENGFKEGFRAQLRILRVF
ncbi:transporter [Novosphingobium profundi]|uniref:transporter n=1 Tax=Novosphingobium profundi TaxID=1774954 RepID=UPI001BD9D199|nr:transporter [Novosphingobium profundi]